MSADDVERARGEHPPVPEEARPEPPLPRSMWLLSDSRRSWLATIVATVLAGAALSIGIQRSPKLADLQETDPGGFMLFACVVTWTFLALLLSGLTWHSYHGLRGGEFQRAVVADPSWVARERRSRSRFVRWTVGYGPSSWSVSVSVLALAVVLGMVLQPALREIPMALSLALVMVAASWFNVAVTYALHYARVHVTDGGLDFPGEQPEGLGDYAYVAIGIMTTFATSDVQVRTRELRAQVMSHGIIAFVFSSVIIALFLSLLLGAA